MSKSCNYVWIMYYRRKDGTEMYQLKHSITLANVRKLAKHYRLMPDIECVEFFKRFDNI